MTDDLERYILDHIDREPDNLQRLDRDTHLRLLYPRMCSGHLQGRLLKMLVTMIAPRRVLELGTYSAHRVHLHIGDALEILEQFDQPFDLIYIDANKRDYVAYYEHVLPRLRPGGFIIADNTLWDGKVTDPVEHHDAQTRGICAFNDLVADDPRVQRVILPLRDGLTIIRKLDNQQ